MPRLTKTIREEFLHSVSARLPKLPDTSNELSRLALICRSEIESAMPKDVQEFAKTWPWLVHRSEGDSFRLERNLTTAIYHKGYGYAHPGASWLGYLASLTIQSEREAFKENVIAPAFAKFKAAVIAYAEAREARNTLLERVGEVANGVATTENLALALPDLANLIPEVKKVEKKLLPVAASQLIKDLKKAGMK